MKKILSILIIAIALTFSACEDTITVWGGEEENPVNGGGASQPEVTIELGSVTTNAATSITTSSATLGGKINSTGNSNSYSVGFLLYTGSASNFTINTTGVKKYAASVIGTALRRTVNTLTDNTTYKFRAYITNEAGTSYGAVKTFTTEEEIPGTNFICLKTLNGHSDVVNSVAFSPDGTKFISGSGDKTIKIWNANTGQLLKTLTGHTHYVESVAFSPDGSRIVSGAGHNDNGLYVGCIKLWNANTGSIIRTWKCDSGEGSRISSVAYSPDGSSIVSGGGKIRIWDVNIEECLNIFTGHIGWNYSVAYSPDGTKIVSGSTDGTIKIWDANTGECLQTLEGHSNYAWRISYSPDGTKIVSGSYDGTIKIWDANTGECLKTLTEHSPDIRSVAFSPDGTKFISGSWDKTIKIWDANTGECLKTLEGHSGYVYSLVYSPDGTKIISGSTDNTIKIWGLE